MQIRSIAPRALIALLGAIVSLSLPATANAALPSDPNRSVGEAEIRINGESHRFARGGDSIAYARRVNGAITAQVDLGCCTASAPTVAQAGSRIYVVIRGHDNAVHYRVSPDLGRTWGAWQGLGGATHAGPAAVSWGGGDHITIFLRGTNNALYAGNLGSAGFSGWQLRGGELTSAPAAVAASAGTAIVAVRGTDRAVHYRASTDSGASWGAWSPANGIITSAPGATTSGLVVCGSDGTEYTSTLTGTTPSAWTRGVSACTTTGTWQRVEGVATATPAAPAPAAPVAPVAPGPAADPAAPTPGPVTPAPGAQVIGVIPATTATGIGFHVPTTDNYKSCWNEDPAEHDPRTWLHVRGLAFGGRVWKRRTASRHVAGTAAYPLVAANGATATLTTKVVSGPAMHVSYRTDANTGQFGPLLVSRSVTALTSTPIVLRMTARTAAGKVYTATVVYRHDPVIASAAAGHVEHNGPGGRWYVGRTAVPTNWERDGRGTTC